MDRMRDMSIQQKLDQHELRALALKYDLKPSQTKVIKQEIKVLRCRDCHEGGRAEGLL